MNCIAFQLYYVIRFKETNLSSSHLFFPPKHSMELSLHMLSHLPQSWCWWHWDKSHGASDHKYLYNLSPLCLFSKLNERAAKSQISLFITQQTPAMYSKIHSFVTTIYLISVWRSFKYQILNLLVMLGLVHYHFNIPIEQNLILLRLDM